MEKKKFAFVSDFDGTLTNKDFYQMIIDDYLGVEGYNLFNDWKKDKYTYRDFLEKIYGAVSNSDEAVLEDILRIEWDDSADKLIKKVQDEGGDFIILNVGTGYYIENLLKEKGLSDIKMYSKASEECHEHIQFKLKDTENYYIGFYGDDKGKFINHLKETYSKVYYAGDSSADIIPCKVADKCFAKGALQHMLRDEKVEFIPINSFRDVEKSLIDMEVIKE